MVYLCSRSCAVVVVELLVTNVRTNYKQPECIEIVTNITIGCVTLYSLPQIDQIMLRVGGAKLQINVIKVASLAKGNQGNLIFFVDPNSVCM